MIRRIYYGHIHMKLYRAYAFFMPVMILTSESSNPDFNIFTDTRRYPFFIAWPHSWYINFLIWKEESKLRK